MPFQIIHTFEGFLSNPPLDGMQVVLRGSGAAQVEAIEQALTARLADLQARGIDGLVVNVGGAAYLEDEEGWALLSQALAVAVRMGFRLWIYDERGYPSGSAGGLTLRGHPELEAQGIKVLTLAARDGRVEATFAERGVVRILRCQALYENGRSVPFGLEGVEREQLATWSAARRLAWASPGLQALRVYYVAALYEGAHAERNYGEKRRYINLLDPAAIARFSEITYERYHQRLPAEIWSKIEAFFTDEPSFMSVVLPPLEGILSTPIPVLDEPDPRVPILPSLPYSAELQSELKGSYGLDLDAAVESLFEPSEEPSAAKCAFWEAASSVYERAFSGQLAATCARLGVKLTGHILYEEAPFENVALHADPFCALKPFQLPGVDLLSNDLQKISVYGHKLPFSCAWLTGKTGIMTETSDFVEAQTGARTPVGVEQMAAALCMQYLLGVREFSYYYDYRARSAEEYYWVNRMIQRTCAYGANLAYTPEAAIYCPYETFWSGYTPSEVYLGELLQKQPEHVQHTQADVLRLCNELFQRNVQYVLCDLTSVEQAVAAGIRRVILPECRVVSQRLVEAAQRGEIELYGPLPEMAYAQGRLALVGELRVRAESEFLPSKLPFRYDEGLLVAALAGRRFYCFNPTDRRLALRPERAAFIYDPFEGRGRNQPAGKPLPVAPGRAVFVTA